MLCGCEVWYKQVCRSAALQYAGMMSCYIYISLQCLLSKQGGYLEYAIEEVYSWLQCIVGYKSLLVESSTQVDFKTLRQLMQVASQRCAYNI